MPDKEKKADFVVTDRRLFSSDGELRQDVVEDEERRAEREREAQEAQQRLNDERAAQKAPEPKATEPKAPTATERQASANAYRESTRKIDDEIDREMRKQGQAHRAQDFEMTLEKFVASIYMSALMQLGLAAPPGEKPMVDLIGARQTIDTLAILQEKTKGNLTSPEQSMLQNCLYELRMAYLEVTNLIAHPPQGGAGTDAKAG